MPPRTIFTIKTVKILVFVLQLLDNPLQELPIRGFLPVQRRRIISLAAVLKWSVVPRTRSHHLQHHLPAVGAHHPRRTRSRSPFARLRLPPVLLRRQRVLLDNLHNNDLF